jgi:deazaflavin-dependent oxidoreductase (nitroreductase family)
MTNEPRKPPDRLFSIINPVMKFLLRSPFSGLVSGRLMLLSYTGRKTGRSYTTPVGYFIWDDDTVVAFSASRWPSNIRGSSRVRLFIHGIWHDAAPAVVDSVAERAAVLDDLIQRFGLKTARQLPIGLPRDRAPTPEDLRAAATKTKVVRFQLLD